MVRAVNIVVTCTQRKKLPAPSRLQVRSLPARRIDARAKQWCERLQHNDVPTRHARDLYCGDSWAVVTRLADAGGLRGLAPRIWVCSAGYGLLPLDAPLPGYAATFSPGHADSVSLAGGSRTRAAECQTWWDLLAEWEGPKPGSPRRVTQLAEDSPTTPMLFAGSEAYLDALRADLGEAGRILGKRCVVISAGAPPKDGLAEHQIPCDARFQREVGGARQSLNVRILLSLLEQSHGTELDVHSAMEVIGTMSQNLDPLEKFARKPMTDEEVVAFIRKERAANPRVKHSPLLRKLRDSGFRCEQSRFKELFLAEVNRHGG